MKILRVIRTLAFGLAVIAASVTLAAGQTKAPSDLLTANQLKDLVAHAKTPADHMKLSKHFAALAVKYDADAKSHDAVAQAYRAMPTASESKRPGAPDTALHCDRLAQLARESAKEARDISAEHQKMATASK